MHLATGEIDGFLSGEIEPAGSRISLDTFIQAKYLLPSCVSLTDKTVRKEAKN
jgi:hypothetical protein